jgi:DNA polymerase-3 subunit delta'
MANGKKPIAKANPTPAAAAAPPGPMFFRDILGQDGVLSRLRTALRQGRLAHAYLFLGPEGVGKSSTTRALAGALNCTQPREDGDACGTCPSCRRLLAGTHPDFLEILPTSEGRQPQIKIEQIREFRRLTAYPPVGGGWRVALIKPAETMNDAAANCLLKTLEEPPPQHLLVLTAGVEDDLFPTVVSRCQKLAFSPLPYSLIIKELMARGRTQPQAALVAALSGGSLGRALSLDPGELAEQRRQVLADLEQLPCGRLTQVLDWAGRLAKDAAKTDHFLLLAELWYRDLLALHFGADPGLLAHRDCLAELHQELARGRPEMWLAHFNSLAAAHRLLKANLNPELTLDILGFRLQHPGYPYESR